MELTTWNFLWKANVLGGTAPDFEEVLLVVIKF